MQILLAKRIEQPHHPVFEVLIVVAVSLSWIKEASDIGTGRVLTARGRMIK
jgi:hypothetical protein